MTTIASALTLGPLWLALVASHSLGGGVPPRGLLQQAKVPTPSSGGFCPREGPKSYPCRVPRNPSYYCDCDVRIELA